MSEQKNAYIHFRDTGEFLTGEPIASKAMSEQDKARKMAEVAAGKLLAELILCSDDEQMERATKALLQFAQERESGCAERCNCEDSWPSYSQHSKPHCPIHSVQQAAPRESEAVRELVDGLKPFADFANDFPESVTPSYCDVDFRHCRNAAALIAKHSKKGEVR